MSRNRSERRRTMTGAGIQANAVPLGDVKRGRKGPEGHHGRVVAPSQEATRAAIAEGRCPWCGRGPFTVLAIHTSKAHGVDRRELREAAGLTKDASICDPEYAAVCAARGQNRDLTPALQAATERRQRGSDRRSFSAAGRAAQSARARNMTPEQHAAAGRLGARASAEVRRVSRGTCSACGGQIPEDARAGTRTCSDECLHQRRKSFESRPSATAASAAKAAGERESLLAEYDARGGGRRALLELAEIRGVQPRYLAWRLRRLGRQVPDGRRHDT